MEHVIQEHTLETPEAHKGEVVLHCMSCGDWVSTEDSDEIIAEFKCAPCPGPQQHDEEDTPDRVCAKSNLWGVIEESKPFCNRQWTDEIMRLHKNHSCYLDEGHEGDCVCGWCDEGYDRLEGHPKDNGGPVFGPSFYSHSDFNKED